MISKNRVKILSINLAIIFILTLSVSPQIIDNAQFIEQEFLQEELENIQEELSNIDTQALQIIEETLRPIKNLGSNISQLPVWGEGKDIIDIEDLYEDKTLDEAVGDQVNLDANSLDISKLSDKELGELIKQGYELSNYEISNNKVNQLDPNQYGRKRFISDTGYDLDQYLFNSGGPIDFKIDLSIDFDPNDPETFAKLILRVFDVDVQGTETCGPEIDQVYFNGELIGTLTGANNQWSTVNFDLDPQKVKKGLNQVSVTIDVPAPARGQECWATEVDWGELVVPFKDVGIEKQDITFEKKANQIPVDIKVDVHNYGTKDVSNVNVKIIDFDPENNTETILNQQTISSIPASSINSITISWTIPTKTHLIRVFIDPDNTIDEADEENNFAERKYVDIEVVKLDFKFEWVFLISSTFPVENEYTATVDSANPIQKVEFTLKEANKKVIDTTEGDGWKAIFQMHEDLIDGWNTLEVIATDDEGKQSDPKTLRIYGVVVPTWLSYIISTWNYLSELRAIIGDDVSGGSPIKIKEDLTAKKVVYELNMAFSQDAWLPIPEIPILSVGILLGVYFKMELDSTGTVKATGGGKLGVGLKISIDELIKVLKNKRLKSFLGAVSPEIKRTMTYIIEISGEAKFGEGGIQNFKLDLKIGKEDEQVANFTVLNTGISFKFFLGIYVIFHLYQWDFEGNTQGWQDRIELEIKPEISIKASLALGTATGYAWELAIKMDFFMKFFDIKGKAAIVYTLTDYNIWDPDTETSETLVSYEFSYNPPPPTMVLNSQGPPLPVETVMTTEAHLDSYPNIDANSQYEALQVWSEFRNGGTGPGGYDIFYSEYYVGSWSAKKSISNNNLPDFYPDVAYTDSGDVVVVWLQYNDTTIVNGTDPFTKANKTQLVYSIYNGVTWTSPNYLTNSSIFKGGVELSRSTDGAYLLLSWWEDNDGNETTITDKTIKSMYYNNSTWSGVYTIGTGQSVAGGRLSSAFDGSIGVISWTSDTDGDIFTSNDQNIVVSIFSNNAWNAPSLLTSDNDADISPSVVITQDNKIHIAWVNYEILSGNATKPVIQTRYYQGSWQSVSNIYSDPGTAGNYTFIPLEIELKNDYKDDIILFTRGISNVSSSFDIGRLMFNNLTQTWSSSVFLVTGSSQNELVFSGATTISDDALFLGYTRDITQLNQTLPSQNTSYSTLSTGIYGVLINRILEASINYEDFEIIGTLGLGQTVTVTGKVRNTGDIPLKDLRIDIYEGATYTSSIFNITIPLLAPGEDYLINYIWTIDSLDVFYAKLIIRVDSNGQYSEFDENNNEVSFLGYSVDPRIVLDSFKYNYILNRFEIYVNGNVSNGNLMNFQIFKGGFPEYGGNLIYEAPFYFYNYDSPLLWYNLDIPNGTEIFYAKLVPLPGTFDSNYTNNIQSLIVRTEPDLVILSEFVTLSSDYSANNNITVQFYLWNFGLTNASNFTVSVYSSNTFIENISVSDIQPGAFLRFAVNWTGQIGLQNLYFNIDPDQLIPDQDRTNNEINVTKVINSFIFQPLNINSLKAIKESQLSTLNDTFQMDLTLSVMKTSTFKIIGRLKEPSGKFSIAGGIFNLTIGSNNILLNFSALQFGRVGLLGPLELYELIVIDFLTNTKILHIFNYFTSSVFDPINFDKSPVLLNNIVDDDIRLSSLFLNAYRDINVDIRVSSWVPSTYTLIGVFSLPDGQRVSVSKTIVTTFSSSGSDSLVTLRFRSEDFFNVNSTGPFVLQEVLVFNQSTLLAYDYFTAFLMKNSGDFSPKPVTFTGRIFENPVDGSDSDVLYNILEIVLEAKIGWSDTYNINAKLSANSGKIIAWSSATTYFSVGLVNITIIFKGYDIWSSLENGPYSLSDVSIYPSSDDRRTENMVRGYQTNFYNYTLFQTGGVVQGFVERSSGLNLGTVVWYTGSSNIFAQTNTTGYYQLAFESEGKFRIFLQTLNIDFFIKVNGELVSLGSNFEIEVKLGEVVQLDFIEPFRVNSKIGDFPTLQSAINNASSGDFVLVDEITNSYAGGIVVNKSLWIQGKIINSEFPIINAENFTFGLKVTSSDVVIRGLNIINATNAGILLDNVDNVAITKVTVMNSQIGVNVTSSTNILIFSNRFINNTVNALDDGLNNWDSGILGNFYSDYAGTDSDNNGLGDTPFSISGGTSIDNFPRVTDNERQYVFVDTEGKGDFIDIQSSILFAEENSVLQVYPGIYIGEIIIDKTMELYAPMGKNTVILSNYNPFDRNQITINLNAPTNLHGITIIGLIFIASENITLNSIILNGSIKNSNLGNNLILSNTDIQSVKPFQRGVELYSSNNVTIFNINFNTPRFGPGFFDLYYYNVYLSGVNNASLRNITINGEIKNNGILLFNTENITVRDSFIHFNTTKNLPAYGIQASTGKNIIIKNNVIMDVSTGIQISSVSSSIIENNTIFISKFALSINLGGNHSLLQNAIYNTSNSLFSIGSGTNVNMSQNTFVNYPLIGGGLPQVFISSISVVNFAYQNIGNYWYTYIGSDANNDGIGDIPFLVYNSSGVVRYDNFPLIIPVVSLSPDLSILPEDPEPDPDPDPEPDPTSTGQSPTLVYPTPLTSSKDTTSESSTAPARTPGFEVLFTVFILLMSGIITIFKRRRNQ